MTADDPQPEPLPPAGRRPRLIALALAACLALLAVDLFAKRLAFARVACRPVHLERPDTARHAIPPHEPITLVPGVLALKLTVNRGAVFGLGQGYRWAFVLVSLAVTVGIAWAFARSAPKDRLLHAAMVLVLAGALGNLYDRLAFGVVRDMLYLFPGVSLPFGWSWPGGSRGLYPWIFNLADVYLCTGIGLILLRELRGSTQRQPAAEAEQESSTPRRRT